MPSQYKEELVAKAKQESEAKEAQLQAAKEKLKQRMQNLSEEDLLEMQRKAAEENQKLIDMIRLAERASSDEHSKSIFARFFGGALSASISEVFSATDSNKEPEDGSDNILTTDKSEKEINATSKMSEEKAGSDEEQSGSKEENTKTSSRKTRSPK